MDPLSTPGEGAQRSLGSRRHRASTFSSPTPPRPNIDRVDSSSDPGHGYYSFSNSSAEPQSVPIEHLRPGSTTSRNAAGHSYAEISSATQSFVSMDSQSGPTDIPHTSTHRSSTESDSADEAVDNTPPGQPQPHPPIESGDDTVRQPAPVVPRSPLEHIVQPSDTPAYPIQEPLEIDSKNIPTTATDTSPPEVPAKAESVHSQKVETQAVPASRTSTSPKVASSNRDRDQRLSTPSRQDSTINVISRPSDAITPTTSHPPLPTEPRKSIANSQRLSTAPTQLPLTKTEPDHASANGPDSTDAQATIAIYRKPDEYPICQYAPRSGWHPSTAYFNSYVFNWAEIAFRKYTTSWHHFSHGFYWRGLCCFLGPSRVCRRRMEKVWVVWAQPFWGPLRICHCASFCILGAESALLWVTDGAF
jgi:hypothetical protein